MPESQIRAGIVPFLKDGRALFMVSSNPNFGGVAPAIAKGRVDKGELVSAAAVREGTEELGLKESNMETSPLPGWSGLVTGLRSSYQMEVYAVLVKDENDFNPTDYETAETVWLTRGQFKKIGRVSHLIIMDKIFDKIEAYIRNK
jgi:8-oxo-dGTP pyrophosphatase MutT (NUDIX family)